MKIHRTLLVAGGTLLTLVLAAGLILAAGAFLNGPDVEAQDDNTAQRTVTASGHGEISVSPDTGIVTLGVQVTDDDVDAALDQSNQTISAITSALTDLGIAEDDITTGNFSIWPEYNPEATEASITRFTVSHTVTIKVREIGQVGDVVSAGVGAGANSVQNVAFVLEDQEAAIDQAREAAIENARHKGQELARLSEGALGQVITISETSFNGGGYPIAGAVAEDAARSSVPFNPGAAIVSVDLQVTWELN